MDQAPGLEGLTIRRFDDARLRLRSGERNETIRLMGVSGNSASRPDLGSAERPAEFVLGFVNILLVDDSSDDHALVTRELQRELPNVAITEVANEADFSDAFANGHFDLIVTDYQLYWSNGLKLLERFKRRWPAVPVIMFTGSGSEEIAVQAMKTGVHDYVLKAPKNFSRLRSSVHLALKLRAHHRELAAAEARYKNLFETVPIGLFRCTPEGRFLDGNPALAEILGSPDRRPLTGRNLADLYPNPAEFRRWREAIEREGAASSVECRVKRANGRFGWVEVHARAVRDPLTREIQYEGSVEDITGRKRAEQEREELIAELQCALAEVKRLSGLLPICASCKKIRDETGNWNVVETYIEQHSQAHFTHSFCPECARQLYPEVFMDGSKV